MKISTSCVGIGPVVNVPLKFVVASTSYVVSTVIKLWLNKWIYINSPILTSCTHFELSKKSKLSSKIWKVSEEISYSLCLSDRSKVYLLNLLNRSFEGPSPQSLLLLCKRLWHPQWNKKLQSKLNSPFSKQSREVLISYCLKPQIESYFYRCEKVHEQFVDKKLIYNSFI